MEVLCNAIEAANGWKVKALGLLILTNVMSVMSVVSFVITGV